MYVTAIMQRWTGHMMDGWGWGMGLGWLIGIAAIVLLIVVIMRAPGGGRDGGSGDSALDIVKKRYARGEIDKQEYERLRRDLE
ncbi:MAG: SHOCT domain-containing protein [Gemmatimonadales bacterium]|jgi:putative membrane protein